MKSYLLILLVFVNILFAKSESSFEKENSFKQDIEYTNEYLTAVAIYNAEEYESSYKLFNKLFLKNSFNTNINYFLALSAIKIHNYEQAIASFDRILIQKPKLNKVRFEFAKLLFKLNNKEEAKKELQILLKSNISKNDKEKIKGYLEKLNKQNKHSFGNATFLLGLNRNSNVNNGLKDKHFSLPGLNNIEVTGESPILDSAHLEMLNINFFNTFKKNNKILLKNNFFLYNKSYFDEKTNNSRILSYKPKLTYFDKKNSSAYNIELGFTRISQEDEKDFNLYSIKPSLNKNRISTSLAYYKALYTNDESEEYDYEDFEYFLSYKITNNFKYYLKLNKKIALSEDRIDINRISYTNALSYLYKVDIKNQINLAYAFITHKYKDYSTIFDSKRKDYNHNIFLNYKYIINKENNILLSYAYNKNRSNQDAYVYSSNQVSINYIRTFQW